MKSQCTCTVKRSELKQQSRIEFRIVTGQEQELVPYAQIRVRAASVRTDCDKCLAFDQLAPRVFGVPEKRVRPRTIGNRNIVVARHELDLLIIEIVSMCDHHSIQTVHGPQIVERSPLPRQNSISPYPQAG